MTDTSAAVALLFDDSELGGQLRDALHERGARIVHEGGVAGLSRELLQQVGADVLVINLDDDADDALDQLYDMIDGDRPRVVFNDAQASRALAGWDRARWARHLAVKVLAMGDIDPPRPEDAREVQVTPAPIAPVPIAPAPVEAADGDAVDEPAAAIGVAPAGGEGDAASPAFEEVATLAAVEPPQDVPVDEPLPTLVADEEAFDLDLDLDGDINLDVESGILLDEDREAATDTGVIAESDDLAAELEALLASGELPDEEGDDTSGPGLRFTGDEELPPLHDGDFGAVELAGSDGDIELDMDEATFAPSEDLHLSALAAPDLATEPADAAAPVAPAAPPVRAPDSWALLDDETPLDLDDKPDSAAFGIETQRGGVPGAGCRTGRRSIWNRR
ncbi:hypothetical protein [Rhodanobacter lindaniclasticus]